MYQINKQTWEEFKEYILSNEDFTEKIVHGTMIGCTKPKYAIAKELINDNYHLEVIMVKYDCTKINVKYYKVTDEQFVNLL